jgi:hypothetical protein
MMGMYVKCRTAAYDRYRRAVAGVPPLRGDSTPTRVSYLSILAGVESRAARQPARITGQTGLNSSKHGGFIILN